MGLSSLLVFTDSTITNADARVTCDTFGPGESIPTDAVQLDEMLGHLIDSGKLSASELIAWLQSRPA